MKTFLSVMCALLMAFSANAQEVERTFDVRDFSAISASHVVKVTFTQGPGYRVKAKGLEKYMDGFKAYKEGGVLKLEMENRNYRSRNNHENCEIRVEVMCPALNEVRTSGVASFTANDVNCDGDFKIKMDGASNMKLVHLTCSNLSASASGASNIKISGVKSRNKVKIDGSGAAKLDFNTMDAKGDVSFDCSGASEVSSNLSARNVDMDMSGATYGKISIKAEKVTSNSSGAGKLELFFRGQEVSVENSGAGKVNLDTDYKLLRACNSGAGNFIITGTADDVKVDFSGASRINTTGLNRF